MMTVYWQPLDKSWMQGSELLRRQINEIFDDASEQANEPAALKNTWLPAAELIDTPNTFEMRVLLPGIDPDCLDIQATRQSVTVTGHRLEPALGKDHTLIGTEFAYGDFQRVCHLPADIHPEQIKANFQHGILHLILPKADLYHKVSVQLAQPARMEAQDDSAALEPSQEETDYALPKI